MSCERLFLIFTELAVREVHSTNVDVYGYPICVDILPNNPTPLLVACEEEHDSSLWYTPISYSHRQAPLKDLSATLVLFDITLEEG